MKYIFGAFSIFFLCGCISSNKSELEKVSLTTGFELLENKVYDSGFRQLFSLKKTYFWNGTEYVGFVDFQTHKKLILYAIDSDEEIEISLYEVIKKGEQLSSFDIINNNTVLVLTHYTNRIYSLNQFGEIQKEIDLNNLLKNYSDSSYSFICTASTQPFMFNDSTMIVRLSANKEFEGEFSYENYYQDVYDDSLPYLFKVNNIFDDSLTGSFGLFGLNKISYAKENFPCASNIVSFANNQILITNNCSGKIFRVDPSLLTLVDTIKLESNIIDRPIKAEPVSLKKMDFGYDSNEHNSNYPTVLSQICYHSELNNYFLSIASMSKPYYSVLQQYDSNFVRINEVIIDSSKYSSFYCLTKNNNFIVKDSKLYKEKPDYYTENTYSLFKYVEN